MQKEFTNSQIHVEENIRTPFGTQTPFTSNLLKIYFTDLLIQIFLMDQNSHRIFISLLLLDLGTGLMMSWSGALPGYTKQPAMTHTWTRQNNTIISLVWVVKLEYFLGTIRRSGFMH